MISTDRFKGPLGWSICSLFVIAVFCFFAIVTVMSPFILRSNEKPSSNRMETLLALHEENTTTDIARFNGRSAFFKPIRIAKPTPPPPPIQEKEEELPPPLPPEPIGPPPPPANYTGPPLIAIIGDEAWFRSGGSSSPVLRLQIGEESNGLKLVKTHEPTLVTVEHRNGTYEIDLFDGEESFFRKDPPPASTNDFIKEVDG